MLGKDTQEFLAIKLPYSHHLLEDIEHECETIATRYEGWGGFKLASQGLECGKLLVKIVESTLCRKRDRGKS
jgi:hypothetical protein